MKCHLKMSRKKPASKPSIDMTVQPCLASKLVLPQEQHASLLVFLCNKFPHISAEVWRQRFLAGKILDEKQQALALDSAFKSGATIYYFREVPAEPVVPFSENILFEDEHLLVVDKPHFLVVSPVGSYVEQTLLRRLQRRLQLPHLTPIHRLDRLTAGVIMFCKKPQSRDAYQGMFRQQLVDREYEALASPLPELDFPLEYASNLRRDPERFYLTSEQSGTANSLTRVEVIERQATWWRYRLLPQTGRKHQLRVHMAALGAPIFGDDLYPQPQQRAPDDFSQPLALLARKLAFTDPISGARQEFVSQLQLAKP